MLGVYCGNNPGIGTAGSFTHGNTQGAISYNGKSGSPGAKAACENACGNINAHMCTPHELSISRQLGVSIDAAEQRIDAGIFSVDGSYYGNDCYGWTSASNTYVYVVINHVAGPLWNALCNVPKPLACCL